MVTGAGTRVSWHLRDTPRVLTAYITRLGIPPTFGDHKAMRRTGDPRPEYFRCIQFGHLMNTCTAAVILNESLNPRRSVCMKHSNVDKCATPLLVKPALNPHQEAQQRQQCHDQPQQLEQQRYSSTTYCSTNCNRNNTHSRSRRISSSSGSISTRYSSTSRRGNQLQEISVATVPALQRVVAYLDGAIGDGPCTSGGWSEWHLFVRGGKRWIDNPGATSH